MPSKKKGVAIAAPSPELLLSAIVDSSDDAIISKDLQGIITSWNASAERIFGYSAKQAIGGSVSMLIPLERADEERAILRKVKKGERVDHFETVRQRKDGELVDVSITISPIRDKTGAIVGASKVARDIGERKRGSRAGLLLAAIVNSSDDAIVSKNLNGVVTSWNEGAKRLFGYAEKEMLGKPIMLLIPSDRLNEEPQIIARIQNGERVEHFETVRRRKDGSLVAVSLTISPIKDETGKIVGASKIARDISEMKRVAAERELLLESEKAARLEAERANRMKDEFLATVSHELRTPLNAIVGWSLILREMAGTTPEIKEGVAVIERNALAQAQLVNDLLDLSRITIGRLLLDVDDVDVGILVQDSLGAVQPAAESKNIVIKKVLSDVQVNVKGDRRRLQQVVWNLLANAVKFTHKGGKIIIGVERVGSHLDITVTDNGQGISPKFLPHVFERFRQEDSSTTRQHNGLGIGLALVKQLVELHGGDVRAESAGLGKGSAFTVSLPLHAVKSVKGKRTAVNEVSTVRTNELGGVKVLVVDDNSDSLRVVQLILSGRGADVRTASSTVAALDQLLAFHPHLILSDIGMPEHDGYELMRRVRRIPHLMSVPAAALTAMARPEDRLRALEAGFQSHVPKPVAPAELVAVVKSLAALSRS